VARELDWVDEVLEREQGGSESGYGACSNRPRGGAFHVRRLGDFAIVAVIWETRSTQFEQTSRVGAAWRRMRWFRDLRLRLSPLEAAC
jgi:hypothetical protein